MIEKIPTASVPWKIRNGYEGGDEVVKRPTDDDTVVDVVVGDHDHCGNPHT